MALFQSSLKLQEWVDANERAHEDADFRHSAKTLNCHTIDMVQDAIEFGRRIPHGSFAYVAVDRRNLQYLYFVAASEERLMAELTDEDYVAPPIH